MKKNALMAGALSLCFALSAHAQSPADCGNPIVVPDKPSLSDFADYSDFLLRIMSYKRLANEQQQHAQACPDAYTSQAANNTDPTITAGPETLDSALARTQRLSPFDYQMHRTWHERSTSRSFVLAPLTPPTLASEHLRTLLANAGEEEPVVFPLTELSLQIDDIKNGRDAAQAEELMVYATLPERERETDIAFFLEENPTLTAEIYPNGNLYIHLDNEQEIILVTGTAEGEL